MQSPDADMRVVHWGMPADSDDERSVKEAIRERSLRNAVHVDETCQQSPGRGHDMRSDSRSSSSTPAAASARTGDLAATYPGTAFRGDDALLAEPPSPSRARFKED